MLTALILAVALTAIGLVTALTPLIVWAATWVVKKILPQIQGWQTLLLIVPAMSLLVTWLSGLAIATGISFLAQFVYGFVAVFINEVLKNLMPSTPQAPQA